MNESEFWEIIEQAKSTSSNIDDRPNSLNTILETKSPEQIKAFAERYTDHIIKAYTWPLWGAAYMIMGGCSDDGFDYFRDWLISEGQKTYSNSVADPDSLAELTNLDEPELEEFRYVAYEVYEQKTGDPMDRNARDYPADPSGTEWDEDDLDGLFPRLAKNHG